MKTQIEKAKGLVYCPICTRYVEGDVVQVGKHLSVVSGQKCPRCSSTLDAAVVVQLLNAA